MEIKDFFQIIIIPVALAGIALVWPDIQRRSRKRTMEDLILRELSEIGPYAPETANLDGWWAHQQKKFIHRKLFEKPNDHMELLLSLDPDMVYYVTQLWQSLEHRDWIQWKYCLGRLACLYDRRLKKFDRQGKLDTAVIQWTKLYEKYTNRDEITESFGKIAPDERLKEWKVKSSLLY